MKRSRAGSADATLPAVPGAAAAHAARRPAGSRALLPAGLAALAVATCAAFAGVLRNGFVLFDDPEYVTQNAHVTSGLTPANLRWFLHASHGSNWHPLTSYSHLLDVQLFGLHPAGHHAVSLALHVANALLLVLVLRRLTGSTWRSLLAGALFALHPLRVESVAWISERKDVLSMLFFLLTLDAWRRWVERPGATRYALVMLALALGLLSKPMLVSTPLVLLLLDVWPLARARGLSRAPAGAPAQRSIRALVVEKLPLFALAMASSVVTFAVQKSSGAVLTTLNQPLGQRAANALVSYVRYVGLTLWPVRLAPYYPIAPVPAWAAIASAILLAAVTAGAIAQVRRRPHLTVGWLWYVITLVPVIGLVQVGSQALADRYTYLPGLGLLVALAWTRVPVRFERAALAAGAAAALVLLVLTQRQVALWKDTVTLFTHTLRVTSGNAMAHDCLGVAYLQQGGRDADALGEFDAAIRILPGFPNAHLNRAEVLHRLGRDRDAVLEYETVRAQTPGNADAAADEALALLGLGRLDDAEQLYRRALALAPGHVDALHQLGVVLASRRRFAEAVALLRRAESLAPDDAGVQLSLGKAIYAAQGPAAEAVAHMRRAIALSPGWAEPCSTLALVLATDPDPAVRDTAEAARLAARALLPQASAPPSHTRPR